MTKALRFPSLVLGIGILAGSPLIGAAASGGGRTISNNTPKLPPSAKLVGDTSSSAVIDVSIWLNPHNKAELDRLAKDLYNPKSTSYRQWLSKSEFASRFGPTASEAKAVKEFFTANHLTIVHEGPENFFIRAKGTVANVNKAFRVALKDYKINGSVVHVNTKDPYVEGEAAPFVASVSGLDSLGYSHPLATRSGGPASMGSNGKTVSPLTGNGSLPFNSKCFTGTRTETVTTNGALPEGTYSGNGYTGASAACGYTPENIWEAYGLKDLYKEGYDGAGQTIVIIDWCGSPTIKSDANAFSDQFGLPKLTSSNFKIINTPTPSYCSAPDPEINIDVEWAHAIAPGANIDLVVPPTASFQDVDEGVFYAVVNQLGNVISGSYGSEEYYTPASVLIVEDFISEAAASLGISANFSSGDEGDFTFDNSSYPASVSAPADSSYSTAVGGISLALKSSGKIAWQSGWGTNINVLAEGGSAADTPGVDGYFNFGSGGGPSGFFAQPSYQSGLPGPGRQLPDVSWLADPYTGAYIAISENFTFPELTYQVYGGTSLACPMFSALWAIANQEAGQPLGQAAPYLYSLPSSTILDVVPFGSSHNVTGKVTDSSGTTSYTANQLASPLEGTTTYLSALWDVPLEQDTTLLLTFGTDSGLMTAPGWDNVTGVGVPNGKAFADYFHP